MVEVDILPARIHMAAVAPPGGGNMTSRFAGGLHIVMACGARSGGG